MVVWRLRFLLLGLHLCDRERRQCVGVPEQSGTASFRATTTTTTTWLPLQSTLPLRARSAGGEPTSICSPHPAYGWIQAPRGPTLPFGNLYEELGSHGKKPNMAAGDDEEEHEDEDEDEDED